MGTLRRIDRRLDLVRLDAIKDGVEGFQGVIQRRLETAPGLLGVPSILKAEERVHKAGAAREADNDLL